MSFPAGTLLLSNAMPKEHQGVAASLVNTIVNYSISIALGIAGTIEGHINDDGKDLLKGYRGAWYLGIGLAGSGILLSLLFGLDEWRKSRGDDKKEG
jgi:MFS family permease